MSDDNAKVTPELEDMVREQAGRYNTRGEGFFAQSMQKSIRDIKNKQDDRDGGG